MKVLKKSILGCMIATMLLLGLSVGGFAREYVDVPAAELYAEKQMAFDWLSQPEVFAKYGRMSDAIWSYAELGMQEFKSSKLVADNLENNGFKVERGVAGMPTAFVATYGSGKPEIVLIAEYDALPMISNKEVPYQDPIVEGAPGHGCGHNQQGPVVSAAALAVKEVMDRYGLRGTLKIMGCPAEETLISRPYMVRAGLFDGADVVLKTHGSSSMGGGQLGGRTSNAMYSALFSFQGVTAHGARPWGGKSALDGVDIMNVATNFLREHLFYSYRMHYVIPSGGEAPNVVPDKASVWYFVRNDDDLVESDFAKVVDCARGAAIASQTELTVRVYTAIHQNYKNAALTLLANANVQLVGVPEWSDEEQAFAKALQKELGVAETGHRTTVSKPYEYDPDYPFVGGGSNDLGDVTMISTLYGINALGQPPGVISHHWSKTASNVGSANWKGINHAAKAIAGTVIDLMTMPEEIGKIKDELAIQMEKYPYRPFLPAESVPPVELNRALMTKYAPLLESSYLEP